MSTPHLRRCSIAKMGTWSLSPARLTNSIIAGADSSHGPERLPCSVERSSSCIAWRLRTGLDLGWASHSRGRLHVENHRLFAACAEETWLELIEVQLEGKKRMTAAEFLRGNSARRRCAARLTAMPAISPARKAAFQILMAVERGQSHSDDLLRGKAVNALSAPDRNLATALVLGVLRWQIRLDHQLQSLLKRPNAKLDPEIRIALRMGAFQLSASRSRSRARRHR